MPEYGRNCCFIFIFLTLTALLSGCAAWQSHQAQEFMDAGHSHANSVRMFGNPRVLETYGRVSGDSENPISLDQLIEIQALSGAHFEGGIYTPDFIEQTEANKALSLANTVNESPDFVAGLVEALDMAMSRLPDFKRLNPYLRIVAAPAGSGVSLTTRQGIESDGVTPLTVLIAFGEDMPNNGADWWVDAISMAAHESLRVQHGITPPGSAANRVNNSTAAYLFGQCAVAWFTLALDASELIVNIDVDLDAFPGLVDGRFAPDMRKIRQIGNESRQGRTLAFAYLYSLAPEDEGAIDLLSPTFQERLAPECDAAPSNVRPFSSGIE